MDVFPLMYETASIRWVAAVITGEFAATFV